eukprot:1664561-Prymnesium_polylepis.1
MVVRAVTDVTGLAAGGTTAVRARGERGLSWHLGAVLKVGQEGGRLLLIQAKVNRGRAVDIMDPDVTPTGPAAAGP